LTDAELLRLVQARDGPALETLYQRCLPSVWRYVYARLGRDTHAAEDVVSETFLAAVRAAATLLPDSGTVTGWLIGIARHKLADRRRSQERAEHVHAPQESQEYASPLEAVDAREQVLVILERLPDEERQALEWKYLEELSVAQIAVRLGRSEKAVEAVLYRARRSFRELLGQPAANARERHEP
jgi:RNA polymerase sigma factor (sigma-70 family)